MNVRDIKLKAKSVLVNRNNIVTVFVFISVITTLANYIGSEIGGVIPFLSLIVTIIMLPFGHGNVVTALKTVNEQGDEVTIEQDGVVGLRRFKDLFGTYFIREILLLVIMMLLGLIIFVIARFTVDSNVFSQLGAIIEQAAVYSTNVSAYLNDPTVIEALGTLGVIFFIGIIIIAIVAFIYSLVFALTPFVLEKYNIRGAKAMSESARLMKGHKRTLFMLYLSYLGWAILVFVLSAVVEMILPIPLILNIIVAALTTYLFGAELNTSLAVFFEEIDLEDKNNI